MNGLGAGAGAGAEDRHRTVHPSCQCDTGCIDCSFLKWTDHYVTCQISKTNSWPHMGTDNSPHLSHFSGADANSCFCTVTACLSPEDQSSLAWRFPTVPGTWNMPLEQNRQESGIVCALRRAVTDHMGSYSPLFSETRNICLKWLQPSLIDKIVCLI